MIALTPKHLTVDRTMINKSPSNLWYVTRTAKIASGQLLGVPLYSEIWLVFLSFLLLIGN